MPAIKHLVVVMLENRSFDHILGFYVPANGGQAVKGLTGTESNPYDPNAGGLGTPLSVQVTRTSGSDGYITDPGPQHEHGDAMEHMYCTSTPGPGAIQNNKGFLYNYSKLRVGGIPVGPDVAARVMRCFDTALQLPAVNTLARNFVILDQWFSSLPGPTWPNRFFAHCATSGGLSGSPSGLTSVWSEEGHSTFGMPTIYEGLSAVKQDWRIYYGDIPQALALARLHDYRDRFFHFSRFLHDAGAGTLPAYSFIEPSFFDIPALGLAANDMHPSHDVRRGDAFIASIYNALRASPSWNETALLVVWDEHGGFYDHMASPAAVSPDAASDSSGFSFRQLGVRVPAILVSPLVPKGVVDSTVFDHSSIPATVKALFGTTNYLTRRDAKAKTFDRLFHLASPRTDMPTSIAAAAGAPPPVASTLSESQQTLLQLANALPVKSANSTAPPAGTDAVATSLVQVSRYLDV